MLPARKHRASRRNQHESLAADIVYTTLQVSEIVNCVWISVAD